METSGSYFEFSSSVCGSVRQYKHNILNEYTVHVHVHGIPFASVSATSAGFGKFDILVLIKQLGP